MQRALFIIGAIHSLVDAHAPVAVLLLADLQYTILFCDSKQERNPLQQTSFL